MATEQQTGLEPRQRTARQPTRQHTQRSVRGTPGGLASGVVVLGLAAGSALLAVGITSSTAGLEGAGVAILVLVLLVARPGFVVVQPNESRVLILFGRYAGTLLEPGLWWVNPITAFS